MQKVGPKFHEALDALVWKLYRARLEDGPSLYFSRDAGRRDDEEELWREL
jgi:hypothetical protein